MPKIKEQIQPTRRLTRTERRIQEAQQIQRTPPIETPRQKLEREKAIEEE